MQESQGNALVPVPSINTPDPGVDPKVQELYQAGERLLQYAEALNILENQDVEDATRDLTVLMNSMEAIEALRVQYVKPHNDHVAEVNAAFKTFLAPMKRADAIFRQKVRDHREAERAKIAEQERINAQKEELARAEMALNEELSQPIDRIPVQQAPPDRYRTSVATLGGRWKWEWEVTDFAALPDAHKVVSPQTILAALRSGKTIPGVTAKRVEDVTVRRVKAEPAQPSAPLIPERGQQDA